MKVCLTCGKVGHKARFCRNGRLKSEVRKIKRMVRSLDTVPSIASGVATARGPFICFICGKVEIKA